VYLQEGNWEGGLILNELEGPRGELPSRLKASPERLPTGSPRGPGQAGQVGVNWNRTITTHDSMKQFNCQVIL
jgi:hypothetical protein